MYKIKIFFLRVNSFLDEVNKRTEVILERSMFGKF